MRRFVEALPWLALCACSDVNYAAPGATTASIIVAEADETDGLRITAYDLNQPISASEGATVLEYEQTLAELGLRPGPISGGICDRPCALSNPAATHKATSGGLAALGGADPAVLDALVPDRNARCETCPVLGRRAVTYPSRPNIEIRFAQNEPSGSIVFGYRTGDVFRMNRDETFEVLCPPIDELYVVDAVVVGDEVYFADRTSVSVAKLSGPTACKPVKMAEIGYSAAFGGGMVGDDLRLYSVTSTGSVLRVLPTGPKTLFQLETSDLGRPAVDFRDGVAVVTAGGTDFARVRGDEFDVDSIGSLGTLRGAGFSVAGQLLFTAQTSAPPLERGGLLVESAAGSFDVLSGPEWNRPYSVAAVENGAFVTLNGGYLAYVNLEQHAACPAIPGFSTEPVYVAERLDPRTAIMFDIFTKEQHESQIGLLRQESAACRSE